jgi:hypothetical protein
MDGCSAPAAGESRVARKAQAGATARLTRSVSSKGAKPLRVRSYGRPAPAHMAGQRGWCGKAVSPRRPRFRGNFAWVGTGGGSYVVPGDFPSTLESALSENRE